MMTPVLLKHRPIVLTTGGTGGHIFPAEALAEELCHRGYMLALVTDRRGATAWSGVLSNLTIHIVSTDKLAGCNLFGLLRGTTRLALGAVEAMFLIRYLRPTVVIGFGGYASVPLMIAAILSGYPTMIHEQNAVLGRANRLLAPWVSRIAVTFVTANYKSARSGVFHIGMPVRPTVQAVRNVPYLPPSNTDTVRILVTGGSQGAHIFSKVVPTALSKLPIALRARLQVSQQVRPEDQAAVAAVYDSLGLAVELRAFFNDVPARLANAHLVIARAGASTVAELTVTGRPAILVPYPYAIDDHQTANAYAMAESGSAWLMSQDVFSPEALAKRLQTLLSLPATLAKVALCARNSALPDAAQRLADMAESLTLYPEIVAMVRTSSEL